MAKKSLGQHFLKNPEKLAEIADFLDIKSGDTLIEIGPGHGELTGKVLASGAKIIAVEKDVELSRELRKKFSEFKNIEIIEGDILKVLPGISKTYNLQATSYKLVGNIPYYITGHLFRKMSELDNKPALIVLTIQKEVAERICARPPKMNLLAASVQIWAEPEIMGFISKRDFTPQPKVDSTIIKLVPQSITISRRSSVNCYILKNYYKLIKILFKQPRKTILNNLLQMTRDGQKINKNIIIGILKNNEVNPNDRPQNLSVEKIKELAEKLYN